MLHRVYENLFRNRDDSKLKGSMLCNTQSQPDNFVNFHSRHFKIFKNRVGGVRSPCALKKQFVYRKTVDDITNNSG